MIPSGMHEFQTMFFGLTNVPATFHRLVKRAGRNDSVKVHRAR